MLKTIRQKVIAASAAVLLLCLGIGGAGLWVQVNLADALKRSGEAADLIRSHMNGDMMHDALRADVLSALLNLGCARPQAESAVRKAKAAGAPADFEPLFRRALELVR